MASLEFAARVGAPKKAVTSMERSKRPEAAKKTEAKSSGDSKKAEAKSAGNPKKAEAKSAGEAEAATKPEVAKPTVAAKLAEAAKNTEAAKKPEAVKKTEAAKMTEAPTGLTYFPNFIDKAEHAALLCFVDHMPWQTVEKMARRVQEYGQPYHTEAALPMPSILRGLLDRFVEQKLFPARPDQLIVNEYLPGQGIAPHTDHVGRFREHIASVSLGSPAVMEFSHPEKPLHSLFLEPQSCVLLTGEARYAWKHSIARRKKDQHQGISLVRGRRVSLTFRNKK